MLELEREGGRVVLDVRGVAALAEAARISVSSIDESMLAANWEGIFFFRSH